MARKPDPDIAWRVGQLHAALRARVHDQLGLEPMMLGSTHVASADPRTAALANSVFLASTYEIDVDNPGYRLRMEAAQSTRALGQSVRAWIGELAPIVEDNLRRMQLLGANARMFPSHEIPVRVMRIASVIDAMEELADLLARQLYHPEIVPHRSGKPVDFVLNEITHNLHEGGFSVAEIVKLTDRQTGDAAKRVRNRLKTARYGRAHIIPPVATETPVKRGQRATVRGRARD